MQLSSVVLPDPDLPTSATSLPRPTSKLTSSSAVTFAPPLPYVLVTPWTLTMGVSVIVVLLGQPRGTGKARRRGWLDLRGGRRVGVVRLLGFGRVRRLVVD